MKHRVIFIVSVQVIYKIQYIQQLLNYSISSCLYTFSYIIFITNAARVFSALNLFIVPSVFYEHLPNARVGGNCDE